MVSAKIELPTYSTEPSFKTSLDRNGWHAKYETWAVRVVYGNQMYMRDIAERFNVPMRMVARKAEPPCMRILHRLGDPGRLVEFAMAEKDVSGPLCWLLPQSECRVFQKDISFFVDNELKPFER